MERRKGQASESIAVTVMTQSGAKPTETNGTPKTEVFLKNMRIFCQPNPSGRRAGLPPAKAAAF